MYKLLNGDLIQLDNVPDRTQTVAKFLQVHPSQVIINEDEKLILISPYRRFNVSGLSELDQDVDPDWSIPCCDTINEDILSSFCRRFPTIKVTQRNGQKWLYLTNRNKQSLMANPHPKVVEQIHKHILPMLDEHWSDDEMDSDWLYFLSRNPDDSVLDWVFQRPHLPIFLSGFEMNLNPRARDYYLQHIEFENEAALDNFCIAHKQPLWCAMWRKFPKKRKELVDLIRACPTRATQFCLPIAQYKEDKTQFWRIFSHTEDFVVDEILELLSHEKHIHMIHAMHVLQNEHTRMVQWVLDHPDWIQKYADFFLANSHPMAIAYHTENTNLSRVDYSRFILENTDMNFVLDWLEGIAPNNRPPRSMVLTSLGRFADLSIVGLEEDE